MQQVALADASVRRSLGTAGRTCLMLDDTLPSVDRVSPRSRPSRPAKSLSHSVPHRVEGQVSSSCSCAQHTRRTPARSTALSQPVIGASQMSDEAAVRDDLTMLMVGEGTPQAPAVSHPSIHLPRRCLSCAAPQEPRIRRSARRMACADTADVSGAFSCSWGHSSIMVPWQRCSPCVPPLQLRGCATSRCQSGGFPLFLRSA